jgi:hypothetical protein
MYDNPYNPFFRQPNRNIQWVNGRNGANSYQLQPNENAIFLDSENEGIFYIKVCDNVGMCSLRIFKFEEVFDTEPKINLEEYVKKSDLEALINSMLGGGSDGNKPVSTVEPTTKQSPKVY